MAGSGFTNDVMTADNVDFSGGFPVSGKVTTNGQLLIGSTASPNIRVGTLGSSDSSINWTVGAGTITGQVAGGTTTGKTITGDTGGALAPTAGNWNILGGTLSDGTNASTTSGSGSTLTVTSINCAKWIVDPTANRGTHQTIQAAITAASSGQTIFIRPGTYTENLTLKAGVNLTAFTGDDATANVTIIGNCTLSTAGSVSISNIKLQTNAANCITVSGSAASVLRFFNCTINCTNSTGITFSSSSASSKMDFYDCAGDLTTTGIALFAHSSAGSMTFNTSIFYNTGLSTTANTFSAGTLGLLYTYLSNPVTTSGTTANFSASQSTINCNPLNVTALTVGSTLATASASSNSSYSGGSASAISISAGARLNLVNDTIGSNATNAITGAGTIQYINLSFFGSSSTVNTTTITSSGAAQGLTNTSPGLGFIGQELVSSVSAVAFTSSTAKSITSLSLTPGVWDVSGMITFNPTGGSNIATAIQVGIGATNNTITGTLGQDYVQFNISTGFGTWTGVVPPLRVAITTTTTYYLVGATFYTSTTCPGNGRFKATRVG